MHFQILIMASTSKISPLAQAYFAHYSSSQGGSGTYPVFRGSGNYPVFRGAPVQTGQGLGDILRSIGRFLLPIATSAAGAFMESASSAISEGKNLKTASQEAIKPTIMRALHRVGEKIQTGTGRRRRRRRAKKTQVSKRKGIKRKRVYKSRRQKRRRVLNSEFNF